jgi:hypothetical protein
MDEPIKVRKNKKNGNNGNNGDGHDDGGMTFDADRVRKYIVEDQKKEVPHPYQAMYGRKDLELAEVSDLNEREIFWMSIGMTKDAAVLIGSQVKDERGYAQPFVGRNWRENYMRLKISLKREGRREIVDANQIENEQQMNNNPLTGLKD